MKTYVISLPESRARRRNISRQLNEQEVCWSFFDAIPGRSALEHFEGLDEQAYFAATGRVVSAGEVGCFASHALLWKLCAQTGEPIVILEDDASLSHEYSGSVQAVAKLIRKLGFIRLQDDGPRQIRQKILVDLSAPFEFVRYQKYPYGAMAYAISPAAAGSFYRQSRLLAQPVDSFIKRFWAHGQPLYGVSPATVCGSRLCDESTIHGRSKLHPGFRERQVRVARKSSDIIRRALFNYRLA